MSDSKARLAKLKVQHAACAKHGLTSATIDTYDLGLLIDRSELAERARGFIQQILERSKRGLCFHCAKCQSDYHRWLEDERK